MPHGSSSELFTSTAKSALLPLFVTDNFVRLNDPPCKQVSVG
jgi:hypothetical protein